MEGVCSTADGVDWGVDAATTLGSAVDTCTGIGAGIGIDSGVSGSGVAGSGVADAGLFLRASMRDAHHL